MTTTGITEFFQVNRAGHGSMFPPLPQRAPSASHQRRNLESGREACHTPKINSSRRRAGVAKGLNAPWDILWEIPSDIGGNPWNSLRNDHGICLHGIHGISYGMTNGISHSRPRSASLTKSIYSSVATIKKRMLMSFCQCLTFL